MRQQLRLPVVFLSFILPLLCGAPPANAAEPASAASLAAAGAREDSARSPDEEATIDRLSGPRELLDLYGIDDSHFAKLRDGPWRQAEDEILMKIFYRLPRFRPTDLERWAQKLRPPELVERPGAHRGEIYRIQGRAVSVDTRRPLPEIVERLGLSRYYRVELEVPDGHRVAVFALDVPHAWKQQAEMYERAAALGFFLKLGDEAEAMAAPIFVARRVAWYPDTLLGNLGMDVGLLDDVWQEELSGGPDRGSAGIDIRKLRLTGKDREAFYEMLAAVGRAEPRQLLGEAQRRLAATNRQSCSVVPLFNRPKTQLGRLVVLSGTARRVVPIRVSQEETAKRLGIDQYYEVYLFTADSQSNPLVFCVRELPPGMPIGEGRQYGERVTIAGFFFKTWAYRRAAQDSATETQWQLAPLLIGREPVWMPHQPTRSNPICGAVAGGLFVVALAAVILFVWLYGRNDRKIRKRTIERQLLPEAGVSLDQLGLDADVQPDFRGVAEADQHRSGSPTEPSEPSEE